MRLRVGISAVSFNFLQGDGLGPRAVRTYATLIGSSLGAVKAMFGPDEDEGCRTT
jgi:hypothetical protein